MNFNDEDDHVFSSIPMLSCPCVSITLYCSLSITITCDYRVSALLYLFVCDICIDIFVVVVLAALVTVACLILSYTMCGVACCVSESETTHVELLRKLPFHKNNPKRPSIGIGRADSDSEPMTYGSK